MATQLHDCLTEEHYVEFTETFADDYDELSWIINHGYKIIPSEKMIKDAEEEMQKIINNTRKENGVINDVEYKEGEEYLTLHLSNLEIDVAIEKPLIKYVVPYAKEHYNK
jgi:hypothetical protein